jgi:hypothetical protein
MEFRRLTGVKKTTFDRMLKVLISANKIKRNKGGRNSKLPLEDQLLMALEYLREYRTYFHIGQTYCVSESTAYKSIKWVENSLIKSPLFSLPGKKELLNSDNNIDAILIDATETPIERPKKSKNIIIQERKSGIH